MMKTTFCVGNTICSIVNRAGFTVSIAVNTVSIFFVHTCHKIFFETGFPPIFHTRWNSTSRRYARPDSIMEYASKRTG